MAYVPVPKDLTKVKTKVMFNLTKRQLVCFSGGALVSVPLFFLLKGPLGNNTAALCMILVMLPFFCWLCMRRTASPWRRWCAISCGSAFCGPGSGHTKPTIFMPPWSGRTT